MKWQELLELVGREPVFPSSLLLSGKVSPTALRLQISRWTRTGRLLQLRRGLYSLAPTWRQVEPHPFLVANAIQGGSYVSLQSALAFHGLIPEHVPGVTSVGPGRPETVRNPLGTFYFRYLTGPLRFGYARLEVGHNQWAFVARPEKALLDLVHLTPGADAREYLRELRLQNTEQLDPEVLAALARQSGKAKLERAAQAVSDLLIASEGEFL